MLRGIWAVPVLPSNTRYCGSVDHFDRPDHPDHPGHPGHPDPDQRETYLQAM